jgi:hypothetical protein
MPKALLTILLGLLGLLAGAARATAVDWGVHGAGEFGAGMVAPGPFSDSWSFSLASGTGLDSSVTAAANLPPLLFIDNGRYSLFDDGPDHQPGGGDDIALSPPGGWPFDGTSGSTQNFAALAAGNYYFLVTGNATGFAGGLYTISSAISPVPEPSISVLLLASLCLMGFVARRRKVT